MDDIIKRYGIDVLNQRLDRIMPIYDAGLALDRHKAKKQQEEMKKK